MIDVPVPTIQKPLTALDYIGALQKCITATEVGLFCERCPSDIRRDARFAVAVVDRLAVLPKLRAVA